MSYEITEQNFDTVAGTLGVITSKNSGKGRVLDVSVRVGSPQLDNYHRIPNDRGAQVTAGASITIEDNPGSIKHRLWQESDRAYRSAAERFIRIQTNAQVRVANSDSSDDFSREDAIQYQGPAPQLKFDETAWSARVRKLSTRFSNFPEVLTSHVSVIGQTDTRYFADTEGTRVSHGRGFARIVISASAKASDGTDLQTAETFEALDADGLPKDEVIEGAIDRVSKNLLGLLKAPESDPFVGPAIFSGRAAGVFFHEIFGHRVEGHRQKDDAEGQTFTKSVGTPCCRISSPWSSTPPAER